MGSEARFGERDGLPISAKGVCLDNAGRVLLCLNWRNEWEMSGGRPDPAESLETCLAREILEEAGLIVSVREMLSEYAFEVQPSTWVRISTYGCALPASPRLMVSSEHQPVAFIDALDLQALPLPDGYRQAITAWRTR